MKKISLLQLASLGPQHFNKVTDHPVGLGMGRYEYEVVASQMLNDIIDKDLPLDAHIGLKYTRDAMVNEGWLYEHGDRIYSFTPKAIIRLYEFFGNDVPIVIQLPMFVYAILSVNVRPRGIYTDVVWMGADRDIATDTLKDRTPTDGHWISNAGAECLRYSTLMEFSVIGQSGTIILTNEAHSRVHDIRDIIDSETDL